jgi:hypothetical protein
VTGERSDERRHLPVAPEPAEAAFRVALQYLVVSRAIETMLWMQFVFVRLAPGRPPTPSRRTVNTSSR